jgi:hypothetical protein
MLGITALLVYESGVSNKDLTHPEGYRQEYMSGCTRFWHPEELQKLLDESPKIKKEKDVGEVIDMQKVKKTRIKHDDNTSITYIKHPERGAKQMIVILDVIKQNNPIISKDLMHDLSGCLDTTQPVHKVFKHYLREMVDNGYISIMSS